MKKLKAILPYFNVPRQVSICVKANAGLDYKNLSDIESKLQISIGFNGKSFSSSTEWYVKGEALKDIFYQEECILPITNNPQNTTFISAEAGMNISFDKKDRWQMTRDEKTARLILHDGSIKDFANGENVKFEIPMDTTGFPISDCLVELEETENCRIFRLITDENTQYGSYSSEREYNLCRE